MGRITLVTGGASAGKSVFARNLAEKSGKELIYIATGVPTDPEMEAKIKRHKMRRGDLWKVYEEPLDIAGVLLKIKRGTVLIDCMTMWINNIIYNGVTTVNEKVEDILKILSRALFDAIIVTNETGWGIVPDNRLARVYREALGAANILTAEKSEAVYLVCAGIPVRIK